MESLFYILDFLSSHTFTSRIVYVMRANESMTGEVRAGQSGRMDYVMVGQQSADLGISYRMSLTLQFGRSVR